MRSTVLFCLGTAMMLLSAAAHADDPRDPTMRNADARARDSEQTRQLNVQAGSEVQSRGLRYEVRQRVITADAGYAADQAQYDAASRDHDRDMDRYARDRAQYERQMADWRRAVAACRAGYYDACAN